MEETGQEHDYLFYSTSNNSKERQLPEGRFILSIAVLFLVLKRRFLSQLFSTFIPAFFATHLIRIKRKPIYDVSRWLGHRDEKQREQSTFITYLDRTICIQTTG